ncbi:hypothetical protein A0O28_0067070 [Trichoderma guizhouense]|uniref:Heterokaryon incompatibility domain-containing protein n=1 Tax=Trichoderma guizhouense TaxID=1491466 RepID=A0A1T3D036_9HYPO|nr:hypothetical protein A0O28_0067070 [Trichoderma guizhouense]
MEEGDFGRPAYECNDSPAVFECIQAWLQRCGSEHESCRARNTQHVPLPTRLLDVGGDDIRLIETTKDEQGIYVCLSHCWGGYQPIRTLQGNIERHKIAIPWDCLPKTFQDAVTIVRKIGLRYLWIDSLCIIQDSTSDWRAEAARMADIYSRAYFTIAALSAKNSKEGCFPTHDHKYEAHYLTPVSFQGKPASVFVRQDHGHPGGYFMSQNTVLGRGPTQPLLDRAWVFQERNLSLRVVYFGKTEIFWECRTAGYCGCRPGIRRDPDRPECIQTQSWRKWQLMVDKYRSLSLTMAKDTFPALSGLARAFQRENKGLGRYLAGHWEAHLPRCLAWTTRESRAAEADWRAPSWSWASVASATYDLKEVEPACSVVAVECRQAGIDPYGELEVVSSSCWLELSGRLFPGTLPYHDDPYGYWNIDMRTTYGHGHFTGDLDFKSTVSPDAIPPGGSLELLCLHLGVSKATDSQKGDEDIFLALRQFPNSDEYERVGLVSFNQLHGKIFPDGQLYSQKEVTVRIK